jgi:hypothetical protein
MTKTGRHATVALVVAAAMMVAGRAYAQGEPTVVPGPRNATIVLHVVNYAGVSRDVLAEAMVRVAKIYERIGVRTEWVEGGPTLRQYKDGQLHLSVLLLSRDMADKKISATGIKDGVLGQAHLPSGRASIFCDRIAERPAAPKLFSIPLSAVIAHEVGHLVLPVIGHSPSGIMSADMDMHRTQLQSFNKAQGRIILTTLIERGAGRVE